MLYILLHLLQSPRSPCLFLARREEAVQKFKSFKTKLWGCWRWLFLRSTNRRKSKHKNILSSSLPLMILMLIAQHFTLLRLEESDFSVLSCIISVLSQNLHRSAKSARSWFLVWQTKMRTLGWPTRVEAHWSPPVNCLLIPIFLNVWEGQRFWKWLE